MPAKTLEIETKKVIPAISCWAQLQSLFSFPTLDLDFETELSLATAKIENNLNRYQTSKPTLELETEKPVAQNNPPLEVKSEAAPEKNPAPEQKFTQIINPDKFVLGNLEVLFPYNKILIKENSAINLDIDFLVDKIIEQVKLIKEKGRVELQLTLQPEELGEIWLSVSLKNGIVSIALAASPETKKVLEGNLEELEEALKRAQLNISGLSITEVKDFKKERRA